MRLSGFLDVGRTARLAATVVGATVFCATVFCATVFCATAGALVAVATAAPAHACERAAFEAVVTDAANALRDLNQKNKPPFQARLKDLKEKRGWSHDQFLKEAAPLVQDAKISEYDERSSTLLEKIQTMGAEGAGMSQPGCTAFAELQGVMKALVDVQTEKWTYMFSKIEQEFKR